MEASTYTRRVAVFLDILGFKQLIGANREGDIARALKLTKEAETGPFHNAPQMRLTAFSDSVVVSDEIGTDGFGYARILHFASYLVWQLLEMGILTRGGVAHGSLHHENGIVFGPALIQAYELESRQAIYPRILVPDDIATAYVDTEVEMRGEQARQISSTLFRRDFDGNIHLHILGPFAHCPLAPKNPRNATDGGSFTAREQLAVKATCLTQALQRNLPPANQPSASAKHHWFQNYLQETLRAYALQIG